MRNRFFMCNCKLPMKLQIFADGGTGEGNGAGADGAMAAELEQTVKENPELARGR